MGQRRFKQKKERKIKALCFYKEECGGVCKGGKR
jgi:hypothetical protein